MRYLLRAIALLLGVILCISNAKAHQVFPSDSLFQIGKEQLDQGNYKNALKIWDKAYNFYHKNDEYDSDPRLGILYIHTATRHNLKDHYRQASKIYLWGFSKQCNPAYENQISLELERIKPLLHKNDYSRYKKKLSSNLPQVCKAINKFWESLDPTINTAYNERLLEHWERINYAQENFDQNSHTVYEADERAFIFIKLGNPDYVRSGNLIFNKSLIRTWIMDAMEFQRVRNGGPNNNFWLQESKVEEFARKAELLHKYQQYEIWKYNTINNGKDLIYLFGEEGDTGEYKMLNSLEEMIPSTAFRKTNSRLSPGFLLQLMLYHQTSIADEYFSDAFSELESNLFIENGLHTSTALSVKVQNQNSLSQIQDEAPNQQSEYLNEKNGIDYNIYQYRLLNEELKPYLATFIISHPHKAIDFDQTKENHLHSDKNYQLTNTIEVLNNELETVIRKKIPVPIKASKQKKANDIPFTSYLTVPARDGYKQKVSVALHDNQSDSIKNSASIFPESLIAITYSSFPQTKQLNTSRQKLVLGDLMIGIPQAHPRIAEKGPTNFKVIHDNKIPQDHNLMVHFEVYNLNTNVGGSTFNLEYEVKALEKNFLKKIFGKKSKVGLNLTFETDRSIFRKDLEIATSPFKPGKYKLNLRVSQPSKKSKVHKSTIFIIEE